MKLSTALIGGDLHIPYQDNHALDLFEKVGKDLHPDVLVLLGDVAECGEFSRFSKPLNAVPWSQECLQIRETLDRFSSLSEERWYLFGNHEYRYHKWLMDQARPVGQLAEADSACALSRDLRLSELGYEAVPWKEHLQIGSLSLTHGDVIRKHSGRTAQAHLEKYGTSVLVGHSHRGGACFRTIGFPGSTRTIGSWENFCLCQPECWYSGGREAMDWQQGFTVVYFQPKAGGFFQVVPLPIAGGRVVFNGHVYDA